MPRLYLYGAAVAVILTALGVSHWRAFEAGVWAAERRYEAQRLELQTQLAEDGEEITQMATELERLRRLLSQNAQDLDNEALANPDYQRPGVGPDGLRRLRDHWSTR